MADGTTRGRSRIWAVVLGAAATQGLPARGFEGFDDEGAEHPMGADDEN